MGTESLWADGLAVPSSAYGIRANGQQYVGERVASRILINLSRVTTVRNYSLTPRTLMRHELTHAITFRMWPAADPATWALEGFARYVEFQEAPNAQAFRTSAVRNAVHSGKFTGQLPASATFYRGDPESVFGTYQLAATVFDFVASRKGSAAATEFYSQFTQVGEPEGRPILTTPRGESIVRGVLGLSSGQFLQAWSHYVRSI